MKKLIVCLRAMDGIILFTKEIIAEKLPLYIVYNGRLFVASVYDFDSEGLYTEEKFFNLTD